VPKNNIGDGRRASQAVTVQLISTGGTRSCSTSICGLSPRDHVTSALGSLHWLPVKQRIEFKLCLLVHQTINGRAPAYLKDLVDQTTALLPDRASNRSACNNDLVTRRTRLMLGELAFSVAAPRYLTIDIANCKLSMSLNIVILYQYS